MLLASPGAPNTWGVPLTRRKPNGHSLGIVLKPDRKAFRLASSLSMAPAGASFPKTLGGKVLEACPRDVGGEDALAFTWPTRARRTRHLSGDPEIAKRTALALDCQTVHDKISIGRSTPSARQGQDLESTNAPSLLRKKLPRCSSRQLRCLRRRWIMRSVRARRRK